MLPSQSHAVFLVQFWIWLPVSEPPKRNINCFILWSVAGNSNDIILTFSHYIRGERINSFWLNNNFVFEKNHKRTLICRFSICLFASFNFFFFFWIRLRGSWNFIWSITLCHLVSNWNSRNSCQSIQLFSPHFFLWKICILTNHKSSGFLGSRLVYGSEWFLFFFPLFLFLMLVSLLVYSHVLVC